MQNNIPTVYISEIHCCKSFNYFAVWSIKICKHLKISCCHGNKPRNSGHETRLFTCDSILTILCMV
jgi:hypothetical protein